jgi:hypothetical protein
VATGPEIVQRYLRKKNDRANHDDRWERMAPYLAPSRMGILGQYTEGSKQSIGVYDSTTMMAAETMAMFIAGHVINPSQQWFGYRMRDSEAGASDAVREWLEECRDRTLKRMSASLFYAEGPESLIDYGGFGTGFLMTEEAPQPVNRTLQGFRGFYFHAEKTGRFCIEEGADGLVDSAWREFEVTARVAEDQWGRPALSEHIQAALREGHIDRKFKIIHAIYPRPRAEQSAGAKGMPWASCWVELEAKHIVHESGYTTFPAAVPRYHKTPGEVYGRGRGDIAFPDTWTLNTAKKMGLEDWALKIRPPILTRSDSVIGTLKLVPAGPTSINTHGMRIQDVIMPFETGSRPEVSQLKEEELRKSIREIFYVDAIRQLLQVEKSEMTAFEFAKKIELLFRLLGPVYGRLEWEYLHRVVDITFDIQMQAGAFPPPPPEVFNTDGQIDVEFQNPIAKAQRAGDVEAFTMAVNDMAPMGQMFPQMFDIFDPDKSAKGIVDIRGVSAKWLRNDKEITALRAARQQQDQQDNALAQLEQAAGAAGKAAPALKMLQGGGAQGVAPAPA